MIEYFTEQGVGYIVFNRPPANGYTLEFHQRLHECIEKANTDPDVNVVVLRSAVEKFFCAGADIKVFATNSTENNQSMVDAARRNLKKIEQSSKLYLAELGGHALGGGLEIALACDLRFASDQDILLGLPEVKLGLIPGNGGSQRLPRLIGVSRAMDLLVTGANITSSEAHRIGLVNRLIPGEGLQAFVKNYAEQLARGASLAIAAVKQGVNQGIEMSLEEALELEDRLVKALYDTEDAQEGFQAFVEKRDPNYRGV